MMKNISSRSVVLLLLLAFGNFCLSAPVTNESAGPIQIVVPVNHTLRLELDALKRILEADDIADRHVVVVSIAGAFRQGKSFLLNFFIKYLSAQVTNSGELSKSTKLLIFFFSYTTETVQNAQCVRLAR